MAEAERLFQYVAVDPSGRRVKGVVSAGDDAGAFERLKRDGLSPISIRSRAGRETASERRSALSDRDLAGLLSDLAALLGAGADMRTAFGILVSRSSTPAVREAARGLSADIGGGESLESAFAKRLPRRFDFVAALIAAGEASSDIAGGFERAADMLNSRIKLQEQFVSIVSYPAFVFVSTIAALSVILFFVIPSLAPLVEDSGAPPPPVLGFMIGLSTFLNAHVAVIGGGALAAAVILTLAVRAGLLRNLLETALLDGPARRTVNAITYGGFSVALGAMLAGGAPVAEALRLAVGSVGMARARARLEPVVGAVRQGQSLSAALSAVPAFPDAVIRLAAVGEASGTMGAMIARAGKLEEEAGLRHLENAGRLLGPALIILFGGMIGLLMAGLLTGVSQLGQTALQ